MLSSVTLEHAKAGRKTFFISAILEAVTDESLLVMDLQHWQTENDVPIIRCWKECFFLFIFKKKKNSVVSRFVTMNNACVAWQADPFKSFRRELRRVHLFFFFFDPWTLLASAGKNVR